MTNNKFLVVLGLDSEKKPHAAKFDLVDEAAVRKAAAVKGFKIGKAKTKEAQAAAEKLIDGKIFDSGKGLVPFVRGDIYDRLLKLLEIEDAAPAPSAPAATASAPSPQTAAKQSSTVPATAKASPPVPTKPADPWAAITVGSVILVHDTEKGADRSWWECVVTGISKDGKILTARWQNYPTLKPFSVRRNAIGLLPPKT